MNKEQEQTSERIATKVVRMLAIVGLVAVLALASWIVLQGIRRMPEARENLTAAVTAITGIFSEAPEETLLFELDTRTIAVNESSTIAWEYIGDNPPETYVFSYDCTGSTTLDVFIDSEWVKTECDSPVIIDGNSVSILPRNVESRFADVSISIQGNELTDITTISVINKDITGTATSSETAPQTQVKETESTTVTMAPQTKPASSQTTVKSQPVYSGPADLAINITSTGVLIPVERENTYFPVSPIPTDEVAAVKFIVLNKGGKTSDTWKFRAELPIEGDSNYKYVSPLQIPLASGMQIEFTLGFDELLEDDDGIIRIELLPDDDGDKTSNNEDSAIIEIDVQ